MRDPRDSASGKTRKLTGSRELPSTGARKERLLNNKVGGEGSKLPFGSTEAAVEAGVAEVALASNLLLIRARTAGLKVAAFVQMSKTLRTFS